MKNVAFFLVSLLLFSGADRSLADDDVDSLKKRLVEIESRIDSLAVPEPCKETSHCKALPVGHRACGGPNRYAIYSDFADTESIAELLKLSEKSEELERRINRLTFAISICVMEMPPVLACNASRCVILEKQ